MATTRRSAEPPQPSDFGTTWLLFTESARPFLVPVFDDRTLDQFLDFRDKVYAIIQDPDFVLDLNNALSGSPSQFPRVLANVPPGQRALYQQAFLEELKACTRAGQVLHSTEPGLSASEEGRKKSKLHLSKLSTTLGSLKDVLGEVPYLKTGVGLFKELVDFFK